jgi:hypothetical protein
MIPTAHNCWADASFTKNRIAAFEACDLEGVVRERPGTRLAAGMADQ